MKWWTSVADVSVQAETRAEAERIIYNTLWESFGEDQFRMSRAEDRSVTPPTDEVVQVWAEPDWHPDG